MKTKSLLTVRIMGSAKRGDHWVEGLTLSLVERVTGARGRSLIGSEFRRLRAAGMSPERVVFEQPY